MTTNNKTILDNAVVNFFSGKKEFRSLSNFWENDIIIKDGDKERLYESGEHCFHGEKYIQLGNIIKDENRKKVLTEYGLKFLKPSPYKTGTEVKKMGGKKGLYLDKEELLIWNNISTRVQKEICAFKISAYQEVKNDLLKSKNKILIHPALRCSEIKLERERIWEGKAIVRDDKILVLGKNMLGNIWMELRSEL
jgi:predicted NAD-dependent protein-ADP-ribosyltransferase YbiA (DUF1768 family)